jgi:catechol 2,3-dioxygenase-like lactoylglutathione lyase family enzyme
MSIKTFFHIGIVVADLDTAISYYSKYLGVEFTRPSNMKAYIEGPNNLSYEQNVVACYSRSEEPYYELIQAGGDGIFSEKNTNQIFYFGMWESDMNQRLISLREQGVGVAAIMREAANGPIIAIITEPDAIGGRIEYVSDALRLPIAAWVLTGYPI